MKEIVGILKSIRYDRSRKTSPEKYRQIENKDLLMMQMGVGGLREIGN